MAVASGYGIGQSLKLSKRNRKNAKVLESQIEFRRADADDAAAIAKVLYESFVEYKTLYTEGGFAATTPDAAQVLERMQEGPAWIALWGGDIIGTLAAVAKGESLYIRGMAVLPAVRGLGVGAGLLQRVEEWARNGHFKRMFLSTTPFLASAIRLYEKFGFRFTDIEPHDLFGTPLLTMEKST
jgi:putative acetyltransferase